MGKQKSFIIVGSTFLALILAIILLSLITRSIKDTTCKFIADNYPIEIGKSKALAPSLYAGGVVEDVDFTYEVENPEIIDLYKGTYSKGAASVYCWVFDDQDSRIPHDEKDKLSVVDGYWYVNGENTNIKAKGNYTEAEALAYATRSIDPVSVNCFILNGIQTDIPYKDTIIPQRNESTGTWFINGEDTGYTYKGIQATVVAKKVGSTKITIKGIIDGEEVTASTNIQVCLPNPNSVVSEHIDDTKIVKANSDFTIDYIVKGNSDSIELPKQDVTYTVVNTDKITVDANGNCKATEPGEYKVRIAAARTSFTEELGQYKTTNVTITIIVLDATDEEIAAIENARTAINSIGEVTATAECKALIDSAKLNVSKVSEENAQYITNIEVLTKAEQKYNNLTNK